MPRSNLCPGGISQKFLLCHGPPTVILCLALTRPLLLTLLWGMAITEQEAITLGPTEGREGGKIDYLSLGGSRQVMWGRALTSRAMTARWWIWGQASVGCRLLNQFTSATGSRAGEQLDNMRRSYVLERSPGNRGAHPPPGRLRHVEWGVGHAEGVRGC